MARVLGIGIATLDIVNTVDGYPPEDAEVRAVAQRVCRGGNATNTLVVLGQLGHRCAWGGVCVDEPDGRRILAELAACGIDTGHCRIEPRGKVPTSYICLNRRNGSRTIVHYRDLPEFAYADFQAIDLGGYDWLHCEGRAPAETRRILARARASRPELPISLEVEKPRPGIETLFTHADVLLFSRHYARHLGYAEAPALLRDLARQVPRRRLVCGWGAAGAYALDETGGLHHSPAYPPPRVVDTLGAGDTLHAGLIHGLLQGRPLAAALDFACRLAGRKCGQLGLLGVGGEEA